MPHPSEPRLILEVIEIVETSPTLSVIVILGLVWAIARTLRP